MTIFLQLFINMAIFCSPFVQRPSPMCSISMAESPRPRWRISKLYMTMMVRLFPLNLLMYEGTVSRDFVWRDCLKGFWLQMKGFNHADIFIAFSINLDFLGHFFIWKDDWSMTIKSLVDIKATNEICKFPDIERHYDIKQSNYLIFN